MNEQSELRAWPRLSKREGPSIESSGTDSLQLLSPDVLVIGGGPAGLSAATILARRGIGVLVVEREGEAGGIPRHCQHSGFAIRDLHRLLDGPTYARRLVASATEAGVEIWANAMVTGFSDHGAFVTRPGGRCLVRPEATILATGARERPRSARLIPGDRPDGVYTTGLLQNLVHGQQRKVGSRAVIIGSELVSWSAAMTLREAGCTPVAMITECRRAESYRLLAVIATRRFQLPILTAHRVTKILGRPRLEAVEIEDLRTKTRRLLECDTLITTGDWIPDNELARVAGLEIDGASKAPLVDATGLTSQDGCFAIGNLVHPVDTADVAALGGRRAAIAVAAWLSRGAERLSTTTRPATLIRAGGALRWISPGVITTDFEVPARDRYLGWVDEHIAFPWVSVSQGSRTVARRRLPWPAAPGRAFRIPSGLLTGVDPAARSVTVTVSPSHR